MILQVNVPFPALSELVFHRTDKELCPIEVIPMATDDLAPNNLPRC